LSPYEFTQLILHCLRLLKGHNIGDVSYQLGHSSISITYDVYGHWVPGKFKSEGDELDRRMGL
jgi:integrase